MLSETFLAAAIAVASASAQSLSSVLQMYSNLSQTSHYILATDPSPSNVTLLLPSNSAYEKLPNGSATSFLDNQSPFVKATFAYHTLNGTYHASDITTTPAFIPTHLTDKTFANVTGGQRVEAIKNGSSVQFLSGLKAISTVTTADITFSGGIIHIIDTLLSIPANGTTAAVESGLVSSAGALALASPLDIITDNVTDITLFAPSNAAFEAASQSLSNMTAQEISLWFTYSSANATLGYSTDLKNGEMLGSPLGKNLTITVLDDGSIFVNNAKIIVPDILLANGVMHVIDQVLNPSSTAGPSPSATAGMLVYPSNTSPDTNLPFTSGIPSATAGVPLAFVPGYDISTGTNTAATPTPTGTDTQAVVMAPTATASTATGSTGGSGSGSSTSAAAQSTGSASSAATNLIGHEGGFGFGLGMLVASFWAMGLVMGMGNGSGLRVL